MAPKTHAITLYNRKITTITILKIFTASHAINAAIMVIPVAFRNPHATESSDPIITVKVKPAINRVVPEGIWPFNRFRIAADGVADQ